MGCSILFADVAYELKACAGNLKITRAVSAGYCSVCGNAEAETIRQIISVITVFIALFTIS